MSENKAHQQMAGFVYRSSYPRRKHNPFPSQNTLNVKIGSALDNPKYYPDKDQKTCNAEGFEQAQLYKGKYFVFQLLTPLFYTSWEIIEFLINLSNFLKSQFPYIID